MSCGQIALKELGIDVKTYYSCEIDKNAIKVTMDNFPNTIQLGDVTKISENFLQTLPKVDLVIFGSPCRSLSKATAGRKNITMDCKEHLGCFIRVMIFCNGLKQITILM